jgi:hypothetical protein
MVARKKNQPSKFAVHAVLTVGRNAVKKAIMNK